MADPGPIHLSRWLVPATAAVLIAAAAAGCGTATVSADTVKIEWLHCMSQHGITIPRGSAATSAHALPGYDVAAAACQSILNKAPAAGGQAQANQQFLTELLRYARCMRAHDIPVPDPVAGGGSISTGVQQPGSRSAVGPGDPRFQAAQDACRQYLPSGNASTAPSGTGQ